MAAAALAMAGAATSACASPADQFSQQDDFTPQPNQIGPRPPHRTLQWNSKTGRWGINFEMNQPQDRSMEWNDTRIGVNYRLAPGLRTGFGVALGPEQAPNGRLNPDGAAPRVRLESSFKF